MQRPIISLLGHKENADVGMQNMLLAIVMMIMGYFLSLYSVQNSELRTIGNTLREGMRLTNLASAVSDTDKMIIKNEDLLYYDSSSGTFMFSEIDPAQMVIVLDPVATYNNYQLLWNKNICEAIEHSYKMLTDRIENLRIDQFIVYNIENKRIQKCEYKSGVGMDYYEYPAGVGSVRNPLGDYVKETSIYSSLSFSYKDYWGRWHKDLKIRQYSAVRIHDL